MIASDLHAVVLRRPKDKLTQNGLRLQNVEENLQSFCKPELLHQGVSRFNCCLCRARGNLSTQILFLQPSALIIAFQDHGRGQLLGRAAKLRPNKGAAILS